jgi:hypothetical protein
MIIKRITDIRSLDWDGLESLANKFFNEAKLTGTLNFAHTKAALTFAHDNGALGLWVLEDDGKLVGAICGMIAQMPFTGIPIAIETFWYVIPEARGGLGGFRLFNIFCNWATDVGVSAIHVAHMEGIHPQRMADYYLQNGFNRLETIYTKNV